MNTHKHAQIDLKWNDRRSRKPSSNLLVSPETKRNVAQVTDRLNSFLFTLFIWPLQMQAQQAQTTFNSINQDALKRGKRKKKKQSISMHAADVAIDTWERIVHNRTMSSQLLSLSFHGGASYFRYGRWSRPANQPVPWLQVFFSFFKLKMTMLQSTKLRFFFFLKIHNNNKKIKKEKEKKMGRLCKRNLGWICTPFFSGLTAFSGHGTSLNSTP